MNNGNSPIIEKFLIPPSLMPLCLNGKKFLIVALLLGYSLYAEASRLQENEYIAKVNDYVITQEAFSNKLAGFHTIRDLGSKMQINIKNVEHRKILNELIDERLMIQESSSMEIDKTADFLKAYNLTRLNFSLGMLRKEEVADKVKITDGEIRNRFIELNESVRLRHLFTKKHQKGEKILRVLREGADFSSVVEKESEDPEWIIKKGGDLGFKKRYDLLKEIAEVAFKLKEREISNLIKTEKGFHIILLMEKRKPDGEIPEKEKNRLRDEIFKKKEVDVNRKYIASLKKKARISIDKDAVKSIKREDELNDGNFVIATVEGEAIKRNDLLKRLKSQTLSGNKKDLTTYKKNLLESLIIQKLLDIEAIKRNYDKDEDFQNRLHPVKNSLLIKFFKRNIIGTAVKLTDGKVKEYYKKNIDMFREPEKVRLSVILLQEEKTAKRMIKNINNGADFGTIAAEMSEDSSASNRGDMGWLPVNAIPDNIREKLVEMKVGELYGPYNIDNKFLIVRFDGREKGEAREFNAVKKEIALDLKRKKYKDLLEDYLARLREVSTIEINQPVLEEFIKSRNVKNQ